MSAEALAERDRLRELLELVMSKERKCPHCEYAGTPAWQNGQWSCQNCFHSMEQRTTTLRLLTPEQIAIAYKPDPYGHLRQALADGKTIQTNGYGEWSDLVSGYDMDLIPIKNLRIKPEPQWLPLGPEDVPIGSVIHDSYGYSIVLSVDADGVTTHRNGFRTFRQLAAGEHFKINRPRHRDADGNPTLWEECRKEAP